MCPVGIFFMEICDLMCLGRLGFSKRTKLMQPSRASFVTHAGMSMVSAKVRIGPRRPTVGVGGQPLVADLGLAVGSGALASGVGRPWPRPPSPDGGGGPTTLGTRGARVCGGISDGGAPTTPTFQDQVQLDPSLSRFQIP